MADNQQNREHARQNKQTPMKFTDGKSFTVPLIRRHCIIGAIWATQRSRTFSIDRNGLIIDMGVGHFSRNVDGFWENNF
jgi:hypothetical protein